MRIPPAMRVRSRSAAATRSIERTIVLAKLPVDGEVIATNRPKAWRGLRVDYTIVRSASSERFGRRIVVSDAEVALGRASSALIRGRGRIAAAVAEAGLKKGQSARSDQAGDNERFRLAAASFAEAVGRDRRTAPVTLETDLGPRDVTMSPT